MQALLIQVTYGAELLETIELIISKLFGTTFNTNQKVDKFNSYMSQVTLCNSIPQKMESIDQNK